MAETQQSKLEGWESLGDELPAPDSDDPAGMVWRQTSAYFASYSRGARNNRIAYQVSRVLTLLLAATVTVLAAAGAPAALSASLAAAIVVLEGLQQLFQWHANWISYRASAEALRRHAFAYAARTRPYDGADRADVLAAALRDLTERENLGWAGTMKGARASTAEPR